MMTKVTLHGALAHEMGKAEWHFDIERPYEALQALEANTQKLIAHLHQNLETEYRFLLNGREIQSMDEIGMTGFSEVDIMPVLKGSGNTAGIALTIVGVILLAVVAWWSFPAWSGTAAAGTAAATMTATQSFFLTVGVALTLGGIAQMLTPTPKVDDTERPENKPSYIYNGPVNTYRQGNPVPFGAGGPFLTGSQIISAGIRSVDILEYV
jgi:predicted phage tail protein